MFPYDYLKILLRELKSIHPKPNRIADFPGISKTLVAALEKKGIKNTYKLYDYVQTPGDRKQLASETGLAEEDLLMLSHLADLSRIKWVGATAAWMLYEIGLDSVIKVSEADPVELHEKFNQINMEKGYYKGKIGLNDIRILVDVAKDLDQDIVF